MRLAIVTAYHKEERRLVERCIGSVRAQSVPVEHILVADGHPQDWIKEAGVRQVTLDRSHGDFGDTPRLVGLVLAIREGFDAIQFLDADNLIDPHHAAMGIDLLQTSGAHMVVLKRRFLRPDGSVINVTSARDEALLGIDTNCYLFARPAFPTALKWALIPKELSYMGDRVFRAVFSKAGHPVALAAERTVGYTNMWANIYEQAGEQPPPGCRDMTAERRNAAAWWLGLGEDGRAAIEATLGVRITVVD